MKKVLLFLAAAALLAVSCAKDPQGLIGDQTKVTFTVDASQVATRAVTGTHGTATRLMVGVYHKNGTDYSYISTLFQNDTVTSWPTVVSLDLAKNETYKIVFWADEGTDAYTINWTNGTVAEAATTIAGNAPNRDAYYKMVEITTNGANGGAITLTRPLAQVNVGTNDLAAYKAAAVYDGNIETQVVVSGVVPGMNLLTGEASTGEPVDLTFSYADTLVATLVSGGNNYGYLGMNFVLCPGDATLTAEISLRKDDAAEAINEFTVSYLPVKTNYRTNIVGKLLTGTVQYSVDVDTDFADDLQKLVAPTFESIEALNTYLAGLTSGPANGDHGDIKPEVAIVSGIGDVKTIVLPNDTLHLALQILAAYSGDDGLTIAYPTGEGAKHTKVLYVTIPELSKLTANLPDTHLELVTGSSVDLTDVHTSAGTFVVQEGARVGTLNIKQGNAYVAGSIDSLKVNPSATSDGQASGAENAVQVFLAKESAVEKIFLNSKTDVVVEQPKDHIDVEATEKKVAVYVNEGADNSSATAQNGGVIYVEANVPCTVTADGTSTAEEGNVSSTVIINENATGSAVVATNGGAIDLTANGNCSASADGVAEDPGSEPTPSTITVKEVKDDTIVIDASTTEGGEIDNESGDPGVIKYYVAQIVGGEKYESLYDAVAAAESGATVEMINNSTETKGFTLTKSLTIDLRDFKVIYDSSEGTEQFPNTRAIKVGGSDAIAVTVKNGTIVVGNNVYGPFRIENGNADVVLDSLVLNNSMAYGLGTKIVDAHSVSISNTVVNSVVGGGIEKGCDCPTTLTNVTVNQTEDDTQHPWISTAISTEYGGPLTVASGSYSGKVAAYLFSSGGTMNINGGSFTGREAAIRVQNNTYEEGWAGTSTINITAGTFVGPLILDAWGAASPVPSSEMNISGGTFTTTTGQGALFQVNDNYSHLTITGGTFSEDPSAYVDLNNYKVEENAGMYTVSPIPVFHITNEEELQQAFDEGHVKMLLENDIDVSSAHTLTLNSGKTATLMMPYCINNLSNLSFVINGNLNITGCGEIWNGETLTVSGTGTINVASTISGSDEFGPFSYEGFFDNSKAMVMENVTITSDVVPFTAIANSQNGTLNMTNVTMDIEDRGIFSNGGGNVTLDGVDIECFYRACFRSQFSENAEVTVTDSKLLSHSYYWNEYNGEVGGAFNQTFQMIGGGHATITNTEIGGVHGAISISKSNNVSSSATINSGRFYTFNPEAPTVKEQVYGAIYLYYSSVIINGGEFIAGGGYPSLRFYGGNAEINGGKFGVGSYNMTPIEYLDAYTLSVKGGCFAKKIDNKYLANGYQWVESGDATYPWAVEQIQ